MAFPVSLKKAVYDYCNNHLATEDWYNENFDFIEDDAFRKRIIEEFKGIRFAYKLYEGIEAEGENRIFEIRHQILAYASIYEAVIHYVLYSYYQDTKEFHKMQHHTVPTKMGFSEKQMIEVKKILSREQEDIYIYHLQERKRDESSVRFDDKCKTAEVLGLIKPFTNDRQERIDLASEIIEIYGYRNAIHLVAEQRKGIEYELELSKNAYRRMKPFIQQIKAGLERDHKGIYKLNSKTDLDVTT